MALLPLRLGQGWPEHLAWKSSRSGTGDQGTEDLEDFGPVDFGPVAFWARGFWRTMPKKMARKTVVNFGVDFAVDFFTFPSD